MTSTAAPAGAPTRALPVTINDRPVLGLFRHETQAPGLMEGWTVLLGPGIAEPTWAVAGWSPGLGDSWIQGCYFRHPADAAVEFARRLRGVGPAAEAVRAGEVRPLLAVVLRDGGVSLVSDDPDALDDQRLFFIDHDHEVSGAPDGSRTVERVGVDLTDEDLDALHDRASAGAARLFEKAVGT